MSEQPGDSQEVVLELFAVTGEKLKGNEISNYEPQITGVITTAGYSVSQTSAKLNPEPVSRTNQTSPEEFLRGFTAAELEAAKRAVPERQETPVGTPVPRAVKVNGSVFLDTNENGRRDNGEKGIAGVMVTDGEKVLRSSEDGSFSFRFSVDDEPHCRFVFATRPTGYRPTNSWFLRIPFAEKRRSYQGNFGFAEESLSKRKGFWFIMTSDSQFATYEKMISIAKDYAQMTDVPGEPAFLISIGDLTMDGTGFQWDMYDRIRAASKIPVYDCFGNHDGKVLDPPRTTIYELRVGPPYYSFDYGGVHFLQFVQGEYEGVKITETWMYPEAKRRAEAWLEADLKAIPEGMPVIVSHHQPLPGKWFDKWKAEAVNIIAHLAGHIHTPWASSRNGVIVLANPPARGGDWGAYSRLYRWVHVSPKAIHTDLRVAGQYKRLNVIAPGKTAVAGPQPLMILAYDSALKVKKVTCRITGPAGKAQQPKLIAAGDWFWQGTFQADCPGDWKFEVEATDIRGQVWRCEKTVSVTASQPAKARPGGDFPWILSGNPVRRVSQGPGAPLYPLWVKNTGSVHVVSSSAVVANGRLYVPVTNPNAGSPGSGVLCLDARTGEKIWHAPSPKGNVCGPVLVRDGVVYVVTAENWVGAFEAETGRRIWAKPLKEEYRPGRTIGLNQTSPVPTKHGLLVCNWWDSHFLLDYTSGKKLAKFDESSGSKASFGTVFDDVIYVTRRGYRAALAIPSGEKLWRRKAKKSGPTSAAIVHNDKLLYASSGGTKAVEASSGELIWSADVKNNGKLCPAPVVWDDIVLVNGQNFTALDLETGKKVWDVKCGNQLERFVRSQRQVLGGGSAPIIAGELAYFGHDDTSLRAVDKTGKVVWEYCLGTPIKTDPVVSGNLLFVHDYAGNLWCFGPAVR